MLIVPSSRARKPQTGKGVTMRHPSPYRLSSAEMGFGFKRMPR
jgi:hypothetical protein